MRLDCEEQIKNIPIMGMNRAEIALQTKTLRDLVGMGVRKFFVSCISCQRHGQVEIESVIKRVPLSRMFNEIPFKCQRCKNPASRVIPD